jgi:glycosyltransferase involved in cell wall biosynthesis
VERAPSAALLEELSLGHDGIEAVASIPADVRTRHYWLTHHRQWRAQAESLVARADVVHAGADNLFKPLMSTAWRLAVEAGVPTVFVQDTDIVLQERELAGDDALRVVRARVYGAVYERVVRSGVARSTLSLLKGRDLVQRYGPWGANVREFHDTSHLSEHVVSDGVIAARRERATRGLPLRFVYCGRFVERKGLATSVELVARARALGANVELHLIGDGQQRTELETLARERGVATHVHFHGPATYGPELIASLATYDALLFTPSAEDTPRMIFDAYAAGLPLVATDIAYVRERADAEHAAVVVPRADHEGAAREIAALASDRTRLLALAPHALAAGRFHAADVWYARRAEWTFEAVENARRRAA